MNTHISYGLKKDDSGEDVKFLNEYLDLYFNDNIKSPSNFTNNKPSKSLFDDVTEQKLKIYQQENQLLVTGILDKNTVNLINTPQCLTNIKSFSSHNRKKSFFAAIGKDDNFGLFPNKNMADQNLEFFTVTDENPIFGLFPKTELNYMFTNYTPYVDSASIQRIMSDITRQISHYTPFRFKQVDSNPNITISFVTHLLSNEAGKTVPPRRDRSIAISSVEINNNFRWTDDFYLSLRSPQYYDIYAILIHEFTHAIGLGHSQYRNTIMYRYHTDGARLYTQDDVDGLVTVSNAIVAHEKRNKKST
jgi:hypothetical protein